MQFIYELDVHRVLGALSGLSLAFSISPQRPSIRNLLVVKVSVYLAFSLAPLTFYLMSSSEKFLFHAAGVFIASLVNSLIIIPLAFRVSQDRSKS